MPRLRQGLPDVGAYRARAAALAGKVMTPLVGGSLQHGGNRSNILTPFGAHIDSAPSSKGPTQVNFVDGDDHHGDADLHMAINSRSIETDMKQIEQYNMVTSTQQQVLSLLALSSTPFMPFKDLNSLFTDAGNTKKRVRSA